jgi:nucleoside-diphosphate-sugar epimerase
MSRTHLIFGTGPLGTSVAQELLRRDVPVVMVNRSGTGRLQGVEYIAGDASYPAFAREVIRGAAVVYHCAQPEYHRWAEEFPQLQSSILEGAAANNARLVIGDNLYMYGDPLGSVLTEDSPQHPTTRKGVVRKSLADSAMAAHNTGRLEVAVSRPSDYFGPGYDVMGDTVFRRALDGKPIQLLGNAHQMHSFSYVPDAGRAMAILGTSERSWGQVWIPPVQRPLTQSQFANLVWAEAGRGLPAKTQVSGRTMTRVLGIFIRPMREMVEMLYEFEKPYIVDSTKFERAFGVTATPLADAIAATVDWYRTDRKAAGARAA